MSENEHRVAIVKNLIFAIDENVEKTCSLLLPGVHFHSSYPALEGNIEIVSFSASLNSKSHI